MQQCGCIKDIFNFSILPYNCCKDLYYQDLSYWMDESYGSSYTKPESYELTITGPAGDQIQQVGVSGLTKLSLSCLDGLYCFKVINCDGIELSRNYLLTYKLDNKIECLYLMREDLREEVDRISYLLDTAKIAAERGLEQKAYEYLERVKDMLSRYDCKCDCK